MEIVNEPSSKFTFTRSTKDISRALRRAARKALELGIKTGTPVYVFRDNKIVDLTKDRPRKSRSKRTAAKISPR